jgi:hypothetical protein
MKPEFITYQKFNDPALAAELTDLLQRHNVNFIVEEQSLTFNPSFVLDNELSMEYAVKISGADFELVNKIVAEEESANLNEVEKDYYLFDFSDSELLDLIAKADEWSAFDNQLAKKILADRGKPVTDNVLSDLNEKRISELKEPEPPQTIWIVVGYMAAFLGGVLGIFIGWYLTTYKKTLPNGERVYGYSAHDRKHGIRIFFLSIIIFAIAIFVRVYVEYNYHGISY